MTSKKNKKAKCTKSKDLNQEVVIFIGVMEWSEGESNLKPTRGKRLALKLSRDAHIKSSLRRESKNGRLTKATFMKKEKIMFSSWTMDKRPYFCLDQERVLFVVSLSRASWKRF